MSAYRFYELSFGIGLFIFYGVKSLNHFFGKSTSAEKRGYKMSQKIKRRAMSMINLPWIRALKSPRYNIVIGL